MDRPMPPKHVGRVVALWRYPVKSMAGEPLQDADVSWHGLSGDRRWAFIRDGVVESGFPWLTIRERPDLVRYRPSFSEPARADKSRVVVHTPAGAAFDVTDPALAAELGPGVRLLKQDRGVFDTMPLSLISVQSIARVGEWAGASLEVQRFRPNLLIDAADGAAFAEDAWLGGVLSIGSLRLRLDKRDGRCVIVNTDPASGQRNPAILTAIARERQGALGVYGSTVTPGRVAVGDAVLLEDA